MGIRRWAAALGLGAALTGAAAPADAFCGFYISGADTKLYNNATMVVPVPVVLQEENVKTLPREIFTHIDQLAAPRLVEYWEQDPCAPERKEEGRMGAWSSAPLASAQASAAPGDHGVTIEAQFTVG